MEINIMSFIDPRMTILVLIIYILGVFMKWSRIKDELIPWFLLVLAVVLCGIISRDVVQGIIQGTLVTGVCVLGNQLYIQTVRKND